MLGEKIEAVVGDDKSLTVEIGGLRLRREIVLVFVRKPDGVHFKILIQNSFLADAQNVEVVSASTVIAYIAEIQIETVLRYFFYVVTIDTIDTETRRGGRIGAVNLVQAVVVVVVVSPIAMLPIEQRGCAFQQRVQRAYFSNIDGDRLILTAAVIDCGIGVVIDSHWVSAAANLRRTQPRYCHQHAYKKQFDFHDTYITSAKIAKFGITDEESSS